MSISVVIPVHNEENNIANLIDKVEHTLYIEHEVIIVNDHSTDNTVQLVRDLSNKYKNIKLVENILDKGFANAIRTGFKNVNTDIIIPIMADLCDDLATIKIMLEKLNEGYDIVCASRYIEGGARLGGSRLKGFFSAFVGRSLYYLLGIPTHDIANAFKMYRKIVLDSIDIRACSFELSMEIPLKAYYLGFRITEVPTIWKERTKGNSSFRMLKLLPNYLKLYIWAIFKHGCTWIKTRMHADKKSVCIR